MNEVVIMEYWHWWVIAGLALFIFEIFVPGFVLGCLGIGAFFTAVVALLDVSLELQLVVFAVTSIISFFGIRPFVLKYLLKGDGLKTNIDSLVGREAIVTKDFEPIMRKGRVKVDGDDWLANSSESIELSVGDRVLIEKVESNTLIVKPK